MFGILHNNQMRRVLWSVALVGGGLIGLGTTASQAQAADYRTFPTPAVPSGPRINPGASAAQMNAGLRSAYNRQHMPGWDWWRTYPWSPYNIYNPYNPYSPYYPGNYPICPYGYDNPNVVYPYVSPSGKSSSSPVYPVVGSPGVGATR